MHTDHPTNGVAHTICEHQRCAALCLQCKVARLERENAALRERIAEHCKQVSKSIGELAGKITRTE